MYYISHPSKSRNCETIDILKETLLKYYLGISVIVQFKDRQGDNHVDFVTVEKNGDVRHSFGKMQEYDFKQLPVARLVW